MNPGRINSEANLLVAVAAVCAAVVIRIVNPGWLLVLGFLPAVLVFGAHLVLAARALRLRTLPARVAALFGAAAACLVGASLLTVDGVDGVQRVPLEAVLGAGVGPVLRGLAGPFVVGYLVSLVLAAHALGVVRISTVPAGCRPGAGKVGTCVSCRTGPGS